MRQKNAFKGLLTGLVALTMLLTFPWSTCRGEQSTGTIDIRVMTDNDDAEEEVGSGDMSLGSHDLEMIHDDHDHKDQIVGIRFQGVMIPQGSEITNAYITFTADETSSQSTNLTIEAELTPDAAQFSSSDSDISDRTNRTDAVNWDDVPAWGHVGETGVKQQTPDLSALVEQIVNLEDWSSGNAMVFIISGSGKRVAESYDGSSSKAPLLHVEYTSDAIERWIVESDDDAEERRDQGGEMSINSSDLDFVQDRLIGLRFRNIAVPRGAEITRAYIVLYADETDGNDSRIDIKMEAIGDAPAFYYTDDNISDRTLTDSSVQWDPVPDFSPTHSAYQTPDLSTLVQQIVGRSDWASDNSMVFVLEGRQGDRVAESYDGADDHHNLMLAPMLHIEYGEGEFFIDEPIITVDTNSIGASVYEGSNPDDGTFTITNTGTGMLEYAISDDADWVSVSNPSGTIEAGESLEFTVDMNTSGLSVGTHEATITISDPDALNTPVEIQVSVTILELPEELTCGNLPVYTQNLVSPAILILLDISGSMDDMMDVAPQTNPQTPNLEPIIEEIIARSGWTENNAMSFIIQGTGKRVAKSYNGNSSEAPLLHVEYTHEGSGHTFEKRISHGDDDAEEYQSGTQVSLGSSDLEMVHDGSRGNQTIGLRFQDVAIPKGTEENPVDITHAYIEFVIDESDSEDTSLTIYGEDMDNPWAFANSDHNISNRTKTSASVAWNSTSDPELSEWSGVTQEMRIDIAKSVISDLVKDRAISWGFGTWCNSSPWDDLSDYTIIHEGTKQNTDEHQAALQAAIDSQEPHGGTPFSFSIEAATNYFEGTKADENSSFYVQSDCQPKFLIEITDGMGNTGSTPDNTRTRTEALAEADVSGVGVGFGLNYNDAEQLYVMADVANEEGNASPNDNLYALHEEIDDVAQPFFAFNKQELIDALNAITENVKGAIFHGSAPAPTTSVDLEDLVIVAKFDASRWIGDLEAVKRDNHDNWNVEDWTASEEMPTSRQLWTITDPDDPNTVTPYTTNTLANDNFQCTVDKPIGDIINSTPVVVAHPPFWYPFPGYMDFLKSSNREPMIYVGANDGFLHAFRLADGVEQWAFMPHNLQDKVDKADDPLFDRCAPEYCHQYYVDGNPIVGDIYADFDGDSAKEWRTILIVGQREGGQSYFALDVTSGKNFDDPEDPARYLWEFNDAELGETWSDPSIDRVARKSEGDVMYTDTYWAAFFGSGYLPLADQQAGKQAYIYGIEAHDASDLWKDVNGNSINRYRIAPPELGYTDLQSEFSSGELVSGQSSGAQGVIIAIDTGTATLTLDDESGTFQSGEVITGNQGGAAKVATTLTGTLLNDALASPLVVDLFANYKADRIYVGNLYGNMYRISAIAKNMTPEVTTLFSYGNTSPNENPIRAKADFAYQGYTGDIWVYFGSGRYESQADKQDSHQQYFFGLKDSLTPVSTYTPDDLVTLQAKFATIDTANGPRTVRIIEGSNDLAQPWKLQLYPGDQEWGGPLSSGSERVISQPLVVGGIVFFTTFIPDENVCAGSGETYVFALDYRTGLPIDEPIFDFNKDDLFNSNDKLDIEGRLTAPGGVYVGRGQGSKPVLHKDTLFITITGDGIVDEDGDGDGDDDDDDDDDEVEDEKLNMPALNVRLENWRHK